MSSSKLALYYYPTTTIFVDDDERFLNALSTSLFLGSRDKISHQFTNPLSALEFIRNCGSIDDLSDCSLLPNVESNEYGVKADEHLLKMVFSRMYHEIYNSQRFKQNSVVVVDYYMPEMTGVEFCRQLKDHPIKKIMLTGWADEPLAVKAFNDRIIDQFILKEAPDCNMQLEKAINGLKDLYFQEQSSVLFKSLKLESSSCVRDPAFIKALRTMCQKNRVIEYYLCSSSGSFLLLKGDGSSQLLVMVSEQDLQDYCAIAIDHHAPDSVIRHLENGTQIPYFPDLKALMRLEGKEWESCLYPAQKIEGESTYFYALLDNVLPQGVEREKIVSYHFYLQKDL